MRIVAVITSPIAFRQWAQRQVNLNRLNADTAMGGSDHHDAWTAHRLDSFDVPWQGGVNEVVLLPTQGETVPTPRDFLPVAPAQSSPAVAA